MGKITVSFPDGNKKEFESGVSSFEIANSIGERLARASFAARIDGNLVDIQAPVMTSCNIELITDKSPESLEILRHSTAHIMAEAIKSLWPDTKLAIGPTVNKGFYYDVDTAHKITPEDFPTIEKKMKELISAKSEIIRREMDSNDAIEHFKKIDDPYKVELISDLLKQENPPKTVSLYNQGEFEDLCRGPHIPTTGYVKAFKLTSLAGAYWRGDETRQMLQRVYGTAFHNKKDLNAHLEALEEAKKRDHRLLGKELDLFSFHTEAPASAFFHGKGTILYNQLLAYIRNILFEQNYEEIMTPQVLDVSLWEKSGHYDNYKDAMYFVKIDDRVSAVKPMNCPGSLLVYNTKKRSYRDLPLKLAELGVVHRHEKSGVTHGLMRVRKFTQDDAHVFCTEDQIEGEISLLVQTIIRMYKDFGFKKVDIKLSTKPEKAIGSDAVWEKAENALTAALKNLGHEFTINPGDGAFYGPKIDFDVYDALDRPWQLGTIQLDFSMPERFDLNYVGTDGADHRPVMIHRAVYGSLERFIGVLIEHYGGNFPLWLAPVQAKILSVSEKHVDYTGKVYETLKELGFRVEKDTRDQKLGYKIREAELQKNPFMLIVGDKEAQEGTVSVRSRIDKTQKSMNLKEFSEMLRTESLMKGGC